jgi:hypothetical protein
VAGLVPAGEAADSAANLEQERALLKSVLAELEGEDHEAPQQVRLGQKDLLIDHCYSAVGRQDDGWFVSCKQV